MARKQNPSVLKFDDLKIIWRTIIQNWYVPVILMSILYLIGYFMTYRQFETYEVSSQVLLKNNDQYNKGSLVDGEMGFYSGGANGTYIDNSNETRVIKSYDLIEKAVKKLKSRLQVSYYIVGRVRTKEEFNGMPFSVSVNTINAKFYEQPFSFNILNNKTYELSYTEDNKEIKQQGVFGKELITINYNLLISADAVTAVGIEESKNIRYEFKIHSLESLVYGFQEKLKIENPDFTNILSLSIEDNLIDRATLFLDTLSQTYIENSLQSRFRLNERTLQYIDKQMEEVSAVLKFFEDTMQNYKSKKSILDLTREEEDYFKKLSVYDEEHSQLNLQVESLNDLEKYIIEGKDPQFLPPSIFINIKDAFLVKEAEQLYNLQIELNNRRNIAKQKNRGVTELENNINKTKQDLLVYINNDRNALKKIMENINSEIAMYTNSIKTIPQKQRDLLGIQRNLTVNEGLYTFLLQKRANTFISRASIIAETKVIESPRPSGKVTPDKQKIILQYIFAGAILSVIIILIRAIGFTTIQNIIELKETTNTPIIGDLIQVKNMLPTGIIVDEEPKSQIAENFRTLRTNLQYLNITPGPKIILFTSNAPGEGKTFCSINLSTMLAKGGKKVLLLELDLHKPRVQKALEMTAEKGISTIVVKQNTIEECIRKTKIENLDVLLSGPVPPNPSEMILSDELKDILAYGKNNYDYTIIDSPPAGLISDSIYLMQFADMSLFVLNTKFANKEIVTFVDDLADTNKIQHFAYILNGVRQRSKGYYYAKYGYGYGYGYGAGYGYGYSGYGYGYTRK